MTKGKVVRKKSSVDNRDCSGYVVEIIFGNLYSQQKNTVSYLQTENKIEHSFWSWRTSVPSYTEEMQGF